MKYDKSRAKVDKLLGIGAGLPKSKKPAVIATGTIGLCVPDSEPIHLIGSVREGDTVIFVLKTVKGRRVYNQFRDLLIPMGFTDADLDIAEQTKIG